MNDDKLINQTLNGEYKVTLKGIKDGEYNIDVEDSKGKSNTIFKVLMGVLVAVVLILVVGMLSCKDKIQESEKSKNSAQEIQNLKQSYAQLQEKVDSLMSQKTVVKQSSTDDTKKQKPVELKEAVSSDGFYGIKKVNVAKTNTKIPDTPKANEKIPEIPTVDQKIPETPKLIKKIPEVPTVK